jgi:O-antigen/teichoic acid export membrane protein
MSELSAEKAARHMIATFGSNLGVAVLSFVNVIIITRALGATGRGQFVFLIAIANLTHYACTFGLQEANANLASRDPEIRGNLASNSAIAALAFGVIGIGIVELLIAVFPAVGGGSAQSWRLVALTAVPILILQNYFRALSQAASRFNVTNLTWMLGPMLNAVLNGALAAAGFLTVHRALLVWILGQTVATVILVAYHGLRIAPFGRPSRRLARSAIFFGLRSHPADVMMLGNYRLDQWILGATRSKAELGIYSVAVSLAETLFYLPEAVKQVARPRLARATRARAAVEGATVFRITTVATFASALVLIAFAPLIVRVVFGSAFIHAAPQLRILALGAFGVIGMKILGNALTAQRRPGLESIVVGVAFIATVGLDIALIPAYGGVGAALASTLSYLVGGAAVAAVFVRVLEIPAGALVPRRRETIELARRGRSALRPRRKRRGSGVDERDEEPFEPVDAGFEPEP